MKKTLLALIASATVLLAGAAQASVTTFDELAPAGDYISLNDISPYSGLTWSADWFASDTSIDGYANAAHSGANFTVNGFGSDALTVSSATGDVELLGSEIGLGCLQPRFSPFTVVGKGVRSMLF